MNEPKLPKLNLGDIPVTEGEENLPPEEVREDTKLFNVRITDSCKGRLTLLKSDPYLGGITWNDLFELFVVTLCTQGLVSEEIVRKIRDTGKWEDDLSPWTRESLGVGTRWSDVGPLIAELGENLRVAETRLSGVQDALYDFVTVIEASELAEEILIPEDEETSDEESLFNIPRGNKEGNKQ